jgi:hypothetical protein
MRAPVRVLHLAASFGLVAASVLAGFTGTDVYLPSVGSAMGVSPWYTTVWVYNPGTAPANVTFYLLKRQANPSPSQFTDTVPPGDVKRYDDAVQFMFHESVFGALRITSNEKILVSSRVYSRAQTAPDRDSKGQFFGGVPASFAIGAGEKTQIVGARQTSSDRNTADFRFNLGVVETTGASCVVTWRLLDETGAAVGSPVSWNLGAREQRQENLWSMFGTGVPNGRVEVEVSSGSGKVIAFGSSVANGSDDPSTVEMYFADSLLADGSSSGGDITAVIAGQGLTGGGTSGDVTLHVGAGAGIQVNADSVQVASGGITNAMLATDAVDNTKIKDGEVKTNDLANASVTYAKISPAGGSNNQVLKIVSGSVQWAADNTGGLTLPYSGSAGNVVTDENGFAEIVLPEWFEALNKDFRYQLTVIGRFAQAIVEEEIHDNHFTIRTNFGHVKVSWQVTGVRNDAYMRAHPMVVEEVKPPEEQGTYLSPKEWGQPEEKGRDYPIIQKMREEQAKHQEEMAKHRDEAAKLRAPAGQQ